MDDIEFLPTHDTGNRWLPSRIVGNILTWSTPHSHANASLPDWPRIVSLKYEGGGGVIDSWNQMFII